MKIEKANKSSLVVLLSLAFGLCLGFCGCASDSLAGYSSQWLYPRDITSVYVEMFDNKSFRRGQEYDLTDALAKRIETETPYKVLSDRDRADSVISGSIVSIGESVLSAERQTGQPLEKQLGITAAVNWKNLKTGQLLMENRHITAVASFSQFQSQDLDYASVLAANRLAEAIVESMQSGW